MPDYIGNIAVPEVVPSGAAFPLVPDFGYTVEVAPRVVIHQFGAANEKIEQRFHLGDGQRRWSLRWARLTASERVALFDFWEARKCAYQPFTLNLPNPDETFTPTLVRFAAEPISYEALEDGIVSTGVIVVEVPTSTPTYTSAATLNRFPSVNFASALTSQVQTLIPLVTITPRQAGYPVIRLSDRRATVDGSLFVPRLVNRPTISQAINGQSDDATFVFGNADRVMRDLVADTDLRRAKIEYSLFHVESNTRIDLWTGEVTGWSGEATTEMSFSASDALFELNLLSPERIIDQACWKTYGTHCPLNNSFPTCSRSWANCQERGNQNYFGGIIARPQQVRIRDNGQKGRPEITAQSLVNDAIYGEAIPEVYTDTDYPVDARIVAGREESDFYVALGVVSAGPIGAFTTPRNEAVDGGGTRFVGHTLDGQPHHGFGTAQPSFGLRTSLGADPTTDNASLAGEGSERMAGIAWVEIRRTDKKGIQPTPLSEHTMKAIVSQGLSGYQWTDATTRTTGLLANPIWIAVNRVLRAKRAQTAAQAAQEAIIDTASAVAAAAICETTVTRADALPGKAGTERQFAARGFLDQQRPLREVLQDVLANCLGYWVSSNGKVKFGIRSNASAVSAYTTGNVILDSVQLEAFQPQFNEISATFADGEFNYQANTITLRDDDHLAQTGQVTRATRNLAFTTSASQAARIITTELREQLGGINATERKRARVGQWQTSILGLDTEAGMVVSLTHPDVPGGSAKFRVERWTLNEDYSITLEGRTVTDSMYDLTFGPKPSDVVVGPVPEERYVDVVPRDVRAINGDAFLVSITEDDVSAILAITYDPPDPIWSFAGVSVHVRRPASTGVVEAWGDYDYNGNPAGNETTRRGTLTLTVPKGAVDESIDVFLAPRSRDYRVPLAVATTPKRTVTIPGFTAGGTTGDNLLVNASFESGLTGWSIGGGESVAAGQGEGGGVALQVPHWSAENVGQWAALPVEPGDVYEASQRYRYAPGSAINVTAPFHIVNWFDVNGAYISSSGEQMPLTEAWAASRFVATAPPNAKRAFYYAVASRSNEGLTAGTLYVDDCLFRRIDAPVPLPNATNISAAVTLTGETGEIVVSGMAPNDANVTAVVIRAERPPLGEPDPTNWSGAGRLQPEYRFPVTAGAAFSCQIPFAVPSQDELWRVWVDSANDDYQNEFDRGTTPYDEANIDVGDLQDTNDIPGHVTLTGSPAVTVESGLLRIRDQYIPPFSGAPVQTIGPFKGVAIVVEYPDSSVRGVGEFPYTGSAVQGDVPANYGTVDFSLPTVDPGTELKLHFLSYSERYKRPFQKIAPAYPIRTITITVNQTEPGSIVQPTASDFSVAVIGYGPANDQDPTQYANIRVTISNYTGSETADYFSVWKYEGASPPANPSLWQSQANIGRNTSGDTTVDWMDVQESTSETIWIAVTACTFSVFTFPTGSTPSESITTNPYDLSPPPTNVVFSPIDEPSGTLYSKGGIVHGAFKVTFTKPTAPHYFYTRFRRRACDSNFQFLPGSEWAVVAQEVESPWIQEFVLPAAVEYWRFEVAAMTRRQEANMAQALFFNVTVPASTGIDASKLANVGPGLTTSGGQLTIAPSGVLEEMLAQDSVSARALRNAAIARPEQFAARVIPRAAIGLLAVGSAEIEEVTIDKLRAGTANFNGAVTFAASSTLTINSDSAVNITGAFGITLTGNVQTSGTVAAPIVNAGGVFADSLAVTNAFSVSYGGGAAFSVPVSFGGGFTNPSAVRSSIGAAAASHAHNISDVSGLQGALDGKAASSHTHIIDNVTGLQDALDGKSNTNHGHLVSHIFNLQNELDGKAAASHTHAASDITGYATVTVLDENNNPITIRVLAQV